MIDSSFVSLTLAVLAAIVFTKEILLAPAVGKLPPSPPSDPIIGNARVMPLEYAYKTFGAWLKDYGDLIYVAVLGRPMIIVNSAQAARDLMEKKGAIYSSRPRMEIMGEMMGWSKTLPFLKYGERFRKHRRMMQQHFNAKAVAAFRPIQSSQVNQFLRNMLTVKPELIVKHVHGLIASSILLTTFGHEVKDVETDEYISLVKRTTKMTTDSGSPGGTIIDLFPVLRHLPEWLPGMGLKRHSLKTAELVAEVMRMPLRELKEKRAAGQAPPCYVNHLLDEYESTGIIDKEHEEDIRCIGAVIYSAGVETTEATIATFFLMMTLHPEIVKRAQEEIDRVIGSDRLPTYEDRPSLPYIEAIMKEIFRFNPAVPIGIPHESTQVDIYRGWTIPSGSMILPNIWQMMRDERYYPDPERFDPERYMSKKKGMGDDASDSGDEIEVEKSANLKEDDPSTLVFGFGRRLCPGRHFAEATVFLTYACFLAAFDIRPYVNSETGKEELPEIAFACGTSSNPMPFKAVVTPRSEKHSRLVEGLQVYA
ncbi:cytochrome P450 [Fomitiporia mediterranea MF3/22]|uniref:cytochrome P450 n=1 Tax=Fomitiporia mediterranea (strain MF3/22) TaxID=694068 RepID=UPI0004408256|nr:cytochrome P450 [Fomitiporia mediterranea MF3/22]EJD04755.1 cytochrome P450 [Fomitiporia mediterranea MF3/22]